MNEIVQASYPLRTRFHKHDAKLFYVVFLSSLQAFGGMGVSGDIPLARFYSQARILRLADGPDEVHMRSVARFEYRKHKSKL